MNVNLPDLLSHQREEMEWLVRFAQCRKEISQLSDPLGTLINLEVIQGLNLSFTAEHPGSLPHLGGSGDAEIRKVQGTAGWRAGRDERRMRMVGSLGLRVAMVVAGGKPFHPEVAISRICHVSPVKRHPPNRGDSLTKATLLRERLEGLRI